MSDDELKRTKPLSIERAKQGRAKCQKCKEKCETGELRIAKINPNNVFGGDVPMKLWFHIPCICESKANKAKIDCYSSDDIEGWDLLNEDDRKFVFKHLGPLFKKNTESIPPKSASQSSSSSSKDNLFSEFNKLVGKIADEPSYNIKTSIIQRFLREGSNRKKFDGDLEVWLKLLIPKIDQRVYNLQDKQIVKLFSRILKLKHEDLAKDLHAGDVSETIAKFFEKSKSVKPVDKSNLTLQDVDNFLEELVPKTREEEQTDHFEDLIQKCTTQDIRSIIRLIKKDLKMNCREKHVLEALHHEAYSSFQKSRNLKFIIQQYGSNLSGKNSQPSTSTANICGLKVMTPISPQLAEACKDFDKALKKYPEGFYSEIKLDGERVQIHKKGNDFKFFSRNLKPVQEHKIAKIKEYLPKAFPTASDLILDSEIIMVDTKTDALLPFGTLGKHKKQELENASACLFIFDCLYFNGEDLTKKSMKARREFLEQNIQPVKHHVQLSECKLLRKKNELIEMTKEVLKKGLEGLVLKDLYGIYEPGKRRWLKVKKDYLLEGSIADSADLVVLGASYGTGKMGSLYSIFLMGCFDEENNVWKTVTKVHSGLDDLTMERVHKQIAPLMEPWNANKKLPKYVQIDRTLIPDAIAIDPHKMPVFEIVAAEFTKSDVHTANSISMRFPRITKIRKDKSPKEATTLDELTHLYEESKSGLNIDELNKLKSTSQSIDDDDDDTKGSKKTGLVKKMSSSSLAGPSKRKTNDIDNANKNDDDDGEIAPKKKMKIPVNTEEAIFNGLILYKTNNLISKELDDFMKYGGDVTTVSKEANLVLYDEAKVCDDLNNLRKLYSPSCRHYQKSWLPQSIKTKEMANPLKHFVTLHQV